MENDDDALLCELSYRYKRLNLIIVEEICKAVVNE